MTLHSAKGLEFSQVYLAGLEDGVFPSYMTIVSDDPEEIEEERRLAYVGITRAKEDLTITYAKSRMIKGQIQYNAVSRFVKEIPADLLDNKLPSARRWDEEDYDSDSFERNLFKTKPFQTGAGQSGGNRWTEAASYLNAYNQKTEAPVRTQRETLSDTVFDKKPAQNNERPAEKKDFSQIVASRPKAVVKKKETPAANKPYIARTLDGLTKGAPTTAPGELEYGIGDRVQHIKYGEGTVLNIIQDTRDFKVTVNFDEYGNKIMFAAFAKLKRL